MVFILNFPKRRPVTSGPAVIFGLGGLAPAASAAQADDLWAVVGVIEQRNASASSPRAGWLKGDADRAGGVGSEFVAAGVGEGEVAGDGHSGESHR